MAYVVNQDKLELSAKEQLSNILRLCMYGILNSHVGQVEKREILSEHKMFCNIYFSQLHQCFYYRLYSMHNQDFQQQYVL